MCLQILPPEKQNNYGKPVIKVFCTQNEYKCVVKPFIFLTTGYHEYLK